MNDHHRRFLANQFGFPWLVSKVISIFLVYYQISRIIENKRPGIPSRKKSNLLPPKTPLMPGTYKSTMKSTV